MKLCATRYGDSKFSLNVHRRQTCAGLLWALAGLSACATKPNRPIGSAWEGRLAVHILSEPPQEFFANFELIGSPVAGSLNLYSPLGTTILSLKWDITYAELIQGSSTLRRDSLTELQNQLVLQSPEAALPVDAWFDWLNGAHSTTPGWYADLSEIAQGRLTAHRHAPLPEIRIRLVFSPTKLLP